jgi:hypothetical protein
MERHLDEVMEELERFSTRNPEVFIGLRAAGPAVSGP